MKLVCDHKALADATKDAAKFLPRMTHMAVLEHLHLEAHSNQLMVSATNLDAGRTVEVEADIETDGRILVPATFAQIAAKARGDLTLEATDAEVSISDGKSEWKLRLGNIEDYPAIDPTYEAETEISAWDQVRAIAEMAGGKDKKSALQGVLFSKGHAVATDSYRMAWCSVGETPESIVPAYAVKALDAYVSAVRFGERHASAVLSDGIWWSRLIDDKPVNWKSLIDRHDPQIEVEISSEALDGALSRALLLGDPHLPIWLDFATDRIGVSRTQDGGNSYLEEVDASVSGEIRMAFNGPFLRSVIDPVDKVKITLDGEHKPIRISGDGWYEALLMPVRA